MIRPKTLGEKRREIGVEVFQLLIQHVPEHLFRLEPLPVAGEHVANRLKTMIALDELGNERGLIVGDADLLRVARSDEAVVQLGDGEKLVLLVGDEKTAG